MSAKSLLVTGTSRGIGRACAVLAAQNGWAVAVNYGEDAKAANAVVETIARGGGRSVALKGDVAVDAEVIGMYDSVARGWDLSRPSSPMPGLSRRRRSSWT